MAREYLAHNPENYTPDKFMRPATGVIGDELKYLSSQLRNALEGGWRIDRGNLLVGTELEIIFFSQDGDPELLWKEFEDSRKNPNYTGNHRAKVKRIERFAKTLQRDYPDDFYHCSRDSRLLIEFRTAPQTLEAYFDNISWLADKIRKLSKKEGLLPVVHSQHIHLSCKSHNAVPRRKSKYKFIDSKNFEGEYIDYSFTRILPLVILPEEYEDDDNNFPRVVETSFADDDSPAHPEFRLLSSEYANDHILNLTLCLRSLYASLMNRSYATDIQPEPLYYKAVREMLHDEELVNFFGQSTLSALCRIVRQYPAVSRREKTIDEIK